MSLDEIEKQVLALSEEERRQFAAWFYQNEGKILPPEMEEEDEENVAISREVMEELLRRRKELDHGNGKTFTVEEMSARVREALDEVHRSRH
jgi:hypothetical protein